MTDLLLMALAQFVATAWGVFAGLCVWGYITSHFDDEEGDDNEAETEAETE